MSIIISTPKAAVVQSSAWRVPISVVYTQVFRVADIPGPSLE
jgi:hypothetical protein